MKTGKWQLWIGILLLSVIVSCSPSINITGTWKNTDLLEGKKVKKVFILAITSVGELRESLENEMAATAKEKGFDCVTSAEAFPSPATGTVVVKKEDIMIKARELGCDGILTFAILDQKETSRYVPGNYMYDPTGSGYYNGFYSYYSYLSPVVYTSGYIANDNYYYLESNFFSTHNEKLIWSVQSEAVNPKNIKKFSKNYTSTLVYQLQKESILKN